MKILHIWSTAGVAGTIAKYMDKIYETDSLVLTRAKHDIYNFANDKVKALNCGVVEFYLQTLMRSNKFDIIHIHSLDKIVPWIKRINPKKPIILHYHGSDIRGKWVEKRKYWAKSDKILVATEDLLEEAPSRAQFQPNPIDIDIIPETFQKRPIAFFTSVRAGKADDLAKKFATKYGLPLEIHNRDEHPLPHKEYIETISNYEYFIDVRREYNRSGIFEVYSLGALEALAAGCKIIDWNGEIHEGLPPEHRPCNVVNKLHGLYTEVLQCS